MKYENHQDLLIKFSGMPLNGGGEGFSKVRDVSPITSSNLENGFGTKEVCEVLGKHLPDGFTIYLSEILQGRDSNVCFAEIVCSLMKMKVEAIDQGEESSEFF